MYHDSVYPVSQTGSTGMAFEAGASGKNLTEWQFGMASLNPRWNVSGTYMQVLPSFISTDQDGNDEKEFLLDYFNELPDLLSMVFLKGYQWPFDVNKIFGGSSVIDLLVYQETVLKKRRVFLDYRVNPGNLEKDRDLPYASMIPEAKEYLSQAGACFGTPIERLKHMNEPAILFYQDHHVDLFKERLEIAVCAQHNNGGLSTNHLWETNLSGLYAIGEVCASHGVTRPGGTALNAGQVGAVRAAEGIFLKKRTHMKEASPSTESGIKERLRIQALDRIRLSEHAEGNCPLSELWINASKRMSAAAGMIRNQVQMETALKETEDDICQFMQKCKIAFCFTTFIVLQAVRYASFSKNVSICHVRLRKSRRRKPRFRIIYRFHRRTPRLSRLPNLWRIISLQTGPENAWPGSPGSNFKRGNTVCLKTPCTSIT